MSEPIEVQPESQPEPQRAANVAWVVLLPLQVKNEKGQDGWVLNVYTSKEEAEKVAAPTLSRVLPLALQWMPIL